MRFTVLHQRIGLPGYAATATSLTHSAGNVSATEVDSAFISLHTFNVASMLHGSHQDFLVPRRNQIHPHVLLKRASVTTPFRSRSFRFPSNGFSPTSLVGLPTPATNDYVVSFVHLRSSFLRSARRKSVLHRSCTEKDSNLRISAYQTDVLTTSPPVLVRAFIRLAQLNAGRKPSDGHKTLIHGPGIEPGLATL